MDPGLEALPAPAGRAALAPPAPAAMPEPWVARPARAVARRLVGPVAATGTSPSVLTLAWIALLGVAGLALGLGDTWATAAAVALVGAAYVLDCLDGEVARATARTSPVGGFLEGFGQWIGSLAILAGAAVGSGHPGWFGPAAAAGATFHLLYLQMAPAVDPDRPNVLIRRVTRALYPLMPIEVNLVLVAAVLGRAELGLAAWTVLASATALGLAVALVATSASAPRAEPSVPPTSPQEPT